MMPGACQLALNRWEDRGCAIRRLNTQSDHPGWILVGTRTTGCGWACLPGLEPNSGKATPEGAWWGVVAALVVSWVFRDLRTGSLPALPEIWMGITFGPLAEELIFRGMLFHGLMLLLRRWLDRPGWIAVIVIAGAFALSHLVKAGITPWQIAAIFLTGCLYGWLRLDSGSTAPPLLAHAAYNAVLFGIAFLR